MIDRTLMKKRGENFRKTREKLGYTLEQVADFLYLKKDFLSDFENGEVSIGVSVLERACNLFGCTLSDLEKGTLNCTTYIFDGVNPDEYPKELLKAIHDVNRIGLNLRKIKELEKGAR